MFELPVPPAAAESDVVDAPGLAVTVRLSPVNAVAVPVPPLPMVKVYPLVGVTPTVSSWANSPPPPPPPPWWGVPPPPLAPSPPSPQHWTSTEVTPAGQVHGLVLDEVSVTVVMGYRLVLAVRRSLLTWRC